MLFWSAGGHKRMPASGAGSGSASLSIDKIVPSAHGMAQKARSREAPIMALQQLCEVANTDIANFKLGGHHSIVSSSWINIETGRSASIQWPQHDQGRMG